MPHDDCWRHVQCQFPKLPRIRCKAPEASEQWSPLPRLGEHRERLTLAKIQTPNAATLGSSSLCASSLCREFTIEHEYLKARRMVRVVARFERPHSTQQRRTAPLYRARPLSKPQLCRPFSFRHANWPTDGQLSRGGPAHCIVCDAGVTLLCVSVLPTNF